MCQNLQTDILNALPKEWNVANGVVEQKMLQTLDENESFKSTDSINYLTRYSNNLIALSQLQTINLAPTEGSKDWLYRNYVYAG